MGDDADEEKGDSESYTLIYVSGAAAVLLLVMLVWAVLDTAEDAQRRDGPVIYAPAISTTPTSTTRKTSTTTRTTSTRTSTTDLSPGAGTSTSETTSEVVIPSESEDTTATTTTTLTNPYATTSPPNAGRT